MKQLPIKSILVLSLLVSMFSFNACQKEGSQGSDTGISPSTHLGYRASLIYGVTVWTNTKKSKLIEMDANSGAVLNDIQVTDGANVKIEDLKGITWMNGKLYITTGVNNPAAWVNAFATVDPTTGIATFISTSTINTVSDIEDDGAGTIYGLQNNSNRLVSITGGGSTYNAIGVLNGLGGAYVSKGLAIIGGTIVLAATSNLTTDKAQMYSTPNTAGAVTFLGVVNSLADLNAGHCGIGYNFNIASVLIGRTNSVTVSGLNSFGWPIAGGVANSVYWGGNRYYFEDLTTSN